ncbi:hypothetical protein CAPTEDRAFT_144139 [Capitella teleta]|uniref:Protein TEX261 n=1 Tax=Capitella teleta TaxID=283909 RepID=R7TXL5_CAPTE|nr:hypothetical protein CAPTEDRAFT_144139 [Capitella teleta]|eukprot:ELT98312.1 hypothetical protein CAPTEDRAFT_144139 [Capitella teleta]
MWFMYSVSWLAFLIQVCFITLSIAAGLYYLAEIVEEYTVMAGKFIKYMIWLTSLVYIGFIIFESLSMSLMLLGLASNGVYLLLLKNFPFIELSSPIFLFSLVLIIINHYMSFSYFASVYHPFTEVSLLFCDTQVALSPS